MAFVKEDKRNRRGNDKGSRIVFLCVFCVEAVLKIISKGLCVGPFTYLRDSWDRLDLFIILSGFLSLSVSELWFLKSFRALKILGHFTATRKTARTFGRAVCRLWDVMLLTFLVLTLFSVIGMGMFLGSLRNKCVMNWTNFTELDNNTEFDFKGHITNSKHFYYLPGQVDALVCGNSSSAGKCPEGFTCFRTALPPNYGFTNFDSFGWAFLSAFRLMMRDFWENLGALTMRAEGKSSIIYFVLVMFFCTFSLTCYILAAFTITFTKETEEEEKKAKQNQEDYREILAALKHKDEEKTEQEQRTCCRRFCSCDCCHCWVQLKNRLQHIVLDPFFDLVIIVCLILNVIFMAMNYYPMTEEHYGIIVESELGFCLIFTLEVVLKILAMGPYDFFQVGWHIYDTALVVLSLCSFIFMDIDLVFLFRLFRLARWWPGFLKWMRITWAGLWSLWPLSLSLVLVTLFFSFFGMNLAGGYYQDNVCRVAEDCELPRWHMSDFFHTFMLVTRALFGEWIETMWDCMEVYDYFMCTVFYGALLFVGNLLILSLFLSLLMRWISDRLAPKDEEKMQTLQSRIGKALVLCGINKAKKNTDDAGEDGMALKEHTEGNGTQSSTLPIGEAQKLQEMKETEIAAEALEDCCCQKCYSCCPPLDLDKSHGCGRVWSNIRQSCFNIVQHNYFSNVMLFIILLSSAALVFEDIYLESRYELKVALGYVDQVIAYLFLLEMLFKWVGYGCRKYFTDGWCWLDFIVTLASVFSVAAQMTGLPVIVVSLKALRPLRILSHMKCTRLSVAVLFRLVPPLLEVLLVSLTVWLFFAMLGVGVFAGKFNYCFNETAETYFLHDVVANKSQCLYLIEENNTDIRWKSGSVNFDNVFNAYHSLFSMATFKGWIDIFYFAQDSSMVEDQPTYENNIYVYIYFVAFLLFGCFFTFNHFLKALFDSYSAQTDKIRTHLLLTKKQLKKFKSKRFCSKRPLAPCPRPQGKVRGWVYDLVSREWFEVVMLVVIIVTVLMVETFDMSEEAWIVRHWFWFAFNLVFIIECALKIFAFRRSYFSDSLNVIDFVVIVFTVIDIFLVELLIKYLFTFQLFACLRLGRITRILHLMPAMKRLQVLFTAWTMSLPAVFNLLLVLFVLMFTYASFGTFNFAYVKHEAFIDDLYNFETIGNSLICMFMVTTWGGWDGFLFPMLNTPPDCDPFAVHPGTGFVGDCGSAPLGVGFFVSYICLSGFVVLTMVIVLVSDLLNIYGQMTSEPLSDLNLQMFFKTWKKFDPQDSELIQCSQLPDFCQKLKEPLRIPKHCDLDLPVTSENQVQCRDVLLALAVKVLGDSSDKDALKATIEEKYHAFMPNSPSQESCDPSFCSVKMNQEEETTPDLTEE